MMRVHDVIADLINRGLPLHFEVEFQILLNNCVANDSLLRRGAVHRCP